MTPETSYDSNDLNQMRETLNWPAIHGKTNHTNAWIDHNKCIVERKYNTINRYLKALKKDDYDQKSTNYSTLIQLYYF